MAITAWSEGHRVLYHCEKFSEERLRARDLSVCTFLGSERRSPAPQRWPACRGDARWLCIHPDVLQYLADVGAVGDEGDDAHLPATDGA